MTEREVWLKAVFDERRHSDDAVEFANKVADAYRRRFPQFAPIAIPSEPHRGIGIDKIGMPPRGRKTCRRLNLNTVGEVLDFIASGGNFTEARNCGQQTSIEIRNAVHGFCQLSSSLVEQPSTEAP